MGARVEFAKFGPGVGVDQGPRVVNLRCPHCRREGAFHPVGVHDVAWTVLGELRQGAQAVIARPSIGIRRCPNTSCNGYVFVVLNAFQPVRTYPPEVIDFDASNLPTNIIATLEEAVKCHAAGAYRAAALMVRRVLEEVCEDKAAKGNNLKERIAALGKTIVVPPELIAAADELRLLGNDAAHIEAKTYDAIEEEEVAVALDLAKELLKAVYQYNALVARMRALKKP